MQHFQSKLNPKAHVFVPAWFQRETGENEDESEQERDRRDKAQEETDFLESLRAGLNWGLQRYQSNSTSLSTRQTTQHPSKSETSGYRGVGKKGENWEKLKFFLEKEEDQYPNENEAESGGEMEEDDDDGWCSDDSDEQLPSSKQSLSEPVLMAECEWGDIFAGKRAMQSARGFLFGPSNDGGQKKSWIEEESVACIDVRTQNQVQFLIRSFFARCVTSLPFFGQVFLTLQAPRVEMLLPR